MHLTKLCEQVKDIEGFVKEEVTDIWNKVMEENTRETDKISAPYHFVVGARGMRGIPGLNGISAVSGINGAQGPNTDAEIAAWSLSYDVAAYVSIR